MTQADHVGECADAVGFPNVLVVCCNPFSAERNNGLTMLNLFSGWPASKLAQIYIEAATTIPPDMSVCSRYWKISPLSAAMNLLGIHRHLSCYPEKITAAKCRTPGWRRFFMGLARMQGMAPRLDPGREWLFGAKSLLNKPLENWIQSCHPEVVYSTLGRNFLMRLALEISVRFGLPIVPHFLDDWVTTEYINSPFSSRLRSRMSGMMRKVLNRSTVRLSICDAMSAEYNRRYGGEFLAFSNCVEASRFPEPGPMPQGDCVRLVYVGGLALDRWKALQAIGSALERLHQNGLRGAMRIHTHPEMAGKYGVGLTRPPFIEMGAFLPKSEVPRALQSADILVHVESFNANERECTRFSLSTKIPEYLMAGRCIVAYGPPECASIRYIQDKKAGVVICDEGEGALDRGLQPILASHDLRQEYGTRGRQLGLAEHEAVQQRRRFRSAIAAGAAAGIPSSCNFPKQNYVSR
jgi:hypothetical protein